MIENQTTEFKREYVDDFIKTVIAFANCNEGKIYIGIEDSGKVCGIENIDGQMLKISNAIQDTIYPYVTMFVDISSQILEDKPIICVTVKKGTARPYFLRSKGIRPEGVFVRQGASTVSASYVAILDMIKDTSGDNFEQMLSFNQDLTFNSASQFFSQKNIKFGLDQKRSLKLIDKDNNFTNLALLLSDQCPFSIKIARFEGKTKTNFRYRNEIQGSLLSVFNETFANINIFNRTRSEFDDLYRKDNLDYPKEALREVILNMLVHRDYSFNAPSTISIFDDRIEFISLGGLVKGITLKDVLIGGISFPRNPGLTNIFYRLDLIESYGTGLVRIKNSYANYSTQPSIEVTEHAFKFTLPNTNYPKDEAQQAKTKQNELIADKEKKLSAQEEDPNIIKIKELCARQGFITRQDLEKTLNISKPSAIRLLRNLVAQNFLLKTGNAKNTRYYLK